MLGLSRSITLSRVEDQATKVDFKLGNIAFSIVLPL